MNAFDNNLLVFIVHYFQYLVYKPSVNDLTHLPLFTDSRIPVGGDRAVQRSNELQGRRAAPNHLQGGQSDVAPALHRTNAGDQRWHLPHEPLTAPAKWRPRQDGRQKRRAKTRRRCPLIFYVCHLICSLVSYTMYSLSNRLNYLFIYW